MAADKIFFYARHMQQSTGMSLVPGDSTDTGTKTGCTTRRDTEKRKPNTKNITLINIEKIAKALNVHLKDLFD